MSKANEVGLLIEGILGFERVASCVVALKRMNGFCYGCDFLVLKCVFWEFNCVMLAVLLWYNILHNPNWVLAAYNVMTSFLVSTMKNLIGISLPVL